VTKNDVGATLKSDGTATFRVWAPFAVHVAVCGTFNNWERLTLTAEGDGYWSVTVPNAAAGQEYTYVLTTAIGQELAKNDPRALQVETAEGNSVLVDTTFDWEGDTFTPPAYNRQVLYELHIGTFNRPDAAQSGTFETATAKLDYLQSLGINMVELMPINSMYMDRGWGYAPAYLYAIESLYGGRRAFLEFVKAAHQRGIGVIVDVVYNHFGPDGIDLWRFDGWYENDKGGIYFYNDWRATTAWGDTRPDFGRTEVREYILGSVAMWFRDCHVDGLRFDSTNYLRNVAGQNGRPDQDIPEAWSLLQEANKLAHQLNPAGITIAEDMANEYITKPVGEGGAGFDSQWEVGFPHQLRDVLLPLFDADRNLHAIQDALTHIYNGNAAQRIVFNDSHDVAHDARLNEAIAPTDAASLPARQRSLLAAVLVLTAPGIPMLFQGQEFMQPGGFNDWHGLDWEQAETFAGMVQAHQHLIALRRNVYGHSGGLLGSNINILLLDEPSKLLAYHRWGVGGAGDDVVVVINFANTTTENQRVPFPRDGRWITRWQSDWKGYSDDFGSVAGPEAAGADGTGTLSIGPYAASVLSQEPEPANADE